MFLPISLYHPLGRWNNFPICALNIHLCSILCLPLLLILTPALMLKPQFHVFILLCICRTSVWAYLSMCRSPSLPFIVGLGPARLYCKCFVVTLSFHCHKSIQTQMVSPYFSGGKKWSLRLNNLAKVTQLEIEYVFTPWVSGSKIHVLYYYTTLGENRPPSGEGSL